MFPDLLGRGLKTTRSWACWLAFIASVRTTNGESVPHLLDDVAHAAVAANLNTPGVAQ